MTALWTPSDHRRNLSQMHVFQSWLEAKTNTHFADYSEFHKWSAENSEQFWEHWWQQSEIVFSKPYEAVLLDADRFPGARWFAGSRLNFAENLLKFKDDHTALIGLGENGLMRSVSYAELFSEVEQLAAAMRASGVIAGDRVAGLMPNIIETVVAMLATTSIGAIWSSCSPDFGVNGACDRFGQIEPKLLFCTEAYLYNGKRIDLSDKLEQVQARLTSLEQTILVPMLDASANLRNTVSLKEFVQQQANYQNSTPLEFEQLPFDHPLYIMFSSGTTGAPKCIVHGAGGTLLQHLKEHKLHTDVKRDDVLFYFTTCGWMMWNWLVSGLACGSTLVLFDGSPFANEGRVLLDAIDDYGISIFGTSAKYIAALEKQGHKPKQSHSLASLKSVLSTGSPLSAGSYDYVYRDIKEDVCLSSISGGTDIISCFILGNPALPVHRGEIQCLGLGMAIEFWNDEGEPCRQEKGELVCTKPFPSTPIGFWQDEDQRKFKAAYFDNYPNIWAHGDYGEITAHGGVIIHGRSDAVLNPGGVRIGTAEIYRQVEKIDAVVDSIVIGQQWQDDVRVVLFVALRGNLKLNDQLETQIKTMIRDNTTIRHVPAKILQVADIPRTISGKIVELAVRNVVHNRPVKNKDALANPEALKLFENLSELQS